MKHAAGFRFALLSILAALGVAFLWNGAQGQMRGPRIGPRVPGGLPRAPKIVKVWTCSGCGKEIGRGLAFPPNTCPHCGARIINGVGNGVPQPGMGGSRSPSRPRTSNGSPPPATGPAAPPPAAAPAAEPPPVVAPNPPGDVQPPPVRNIPMFNPPPSAPPSGSSNGSAALSDSSDSPRRGIIIALVIGIVVVGGGLVAGGAWFIIHNINRNGSRPRRRRRRRDEYDERD